MDQKKAFVDRALHEDVTFTELCAEHGVSRKTGYKWLERFLSDGQRGLIEKSRAPNSRSTTVNVDAILQIIAIKQKHQHWGPKKIRQIVSRNLGATATPGVSTVYRILKKAGLVKKRRVRNVKATGRIQNRIEPHECNDVWAVDFKGWWKTQDDRKCTPLTITDRTSRMVLRVQRVDNMSTETVMAVFESAFREFGLPRVIRSDNGTPFATANGLHGLSRLSVWWMALGILPDRIDPGKPAQNGGHERMHRDLKAEVQKSILVDLAGSQAALDVWRQEFNWQRPHEALGMKTPSEVYSSSPRKYEPVDELQYPDGFLVRKVDASGHVKLSNTRIHISKCFAGYHLGLKPVDERAMSLWLGEFNIGHLDLITFSFSGEGVKI